MKTNKITAAIIAATLATTAFATTAFADAPYKLTGTEWSDGNTTYTFTSDTEGVSYDAAFDYTLNFYWCYSEKDGKYLINTQGTDFDSSDNICFTVDGDQLTVDGVVSTATYTKVKSTKKEADKVEEVAAPEKEEPAAPAEKEEEEDNTVDAEEIITDEEDDAITEEEPADAEVEETAPAITAANLSIPGDLITEAYSKAGKDTVICFKLREAKPFELPLIITANGKTLKYTIASSGKNGTCYFPVQDMLDKLNITVTDIESIAFGGDISFIADFSLTAGKYTPSTGDENPATGVSLAVIPAALAGVVAFFTRKRK